LSASGAAGGAAAGDTATGGAAAGGAMAGGGAAAQLTMLAAQAESAMDRTNFITAPGFMKSADRGRQNSGAIGRWRF